VAFSPSGVKTPSRGGPARPGMPEQKAEPFGEEAFQFMRNMFLQRDAVVTVESCDRSGTFLGRSAIAIVTSTPVEISPSE
jgi:staphylococcal nuclease domain-containing protein 1